MHGLSILRSRFFRILYASYAAILLITALLVGWLVSSGLDTALRDDLHGSLRKRAALLHPIASEILSEPYSEAHQARIVELGSQSASRITLIRADGRVATDSDFDPGAMDNHANRPEVVTARSEGWGYSERYSHTLSREMLYFVSRMPDDLGYVRVALPLSLIRERLAATRRSVLLGTSVGLFLALGVGLFLASRITGPIATMVSVAEELRAGKYDSRVNIESKGEFRVLADTFNRLGSELTQRIAALSEEDARLRAMLAGMVEGVVAIDEDERVSFCNSAARAALGITAAQVEGRRIWEVAANAKLEALLEEARASSRPAHGQLEYFRNSQEHVLDAHAGRFQGGGREGIVVVLHDITELRRLERVRRDFVANVSHELKTPLASIMGFVETLLDGAVDDKEINEHFLQRIQVNVERLNHLVSDLLSLARIEADDRIQLAGVSWKSVLAEVRPRHEERMQGKDLELILAGDPPDVIGDREAMVQVLDNLLDNAIKYTPSPGQIQVRFAVEGERGILTVADTGIGIPSEDLDRVFERFYRVDKARSRQVGGTGLGLSIVKNLILNMGGEVSVASEEGRGTTFRVSLPLA